MDLWSALEILLSCMEGKEVYLEWLHESLGREEFEMAIRPILLFCFCFFPFFCNSFEEFIQNIYPRGERKHAACQKPRHISQDFERGQTVLHATHLTVEDGLTEMPSRAGVPQGSVFSLIILSSTSPPFENLHDPSLSTFFSSPLPTSALFSCLSLHLGPLMT